MVRAQFERGAKIRRMEKNLVRPTTALRQIGAIMVSESQRSFKSQGLQGDRWQGRSVPNVFGIISDFTNGAAAPPARRFQDRPALRDTGRLSGSISFQLVGDTSVDVGTNLPYAQVHQTGGEIESETITSDVQSRLSKWLKGRGKGWKDSLGWLLGARWTGEKLKSRVPERKFLGITRETEQAVQRLVGVSITEAR